MLGNQVETDDSSEWAGWIFADMLVGLMVVFLATITFVSTQDSVVDPNYTYTEHFDQQFTAIYRDGEIGNLEADVTFFLVSNNIPKDAVVDSVMYIGGETKGAEKAGHGVSAAMNFSDLVDKNFPDWLKHATTNLNSSTDIDSNSVAVVMTFSAKVGTNK